MAANGIKQANIPLGYGIHRTPTIGNDGELSELVNLMPKNGELVNIQPPQDLTFTEEVDGEEVEHIIRVGRHDTLLAVHKSSSYLHYIVLEDPSITTSTSSPGRRVKKPLRPVELEVNQEPPYFVEVNLSGDYQEQDSFILTTTTGQTINVVLSEDNTASVTIGGTTTTYNNSSMVESTLKYRIVLPNEFGWDKDTNQFTGASSDTDQSSSDTELDLDTTINLYEENDGDLSDRDKTTNSEDIFYKLWWTENGSLGQYNLICTSGASNPIIGVKTIGNTLVVMFQTHTDYYVWKDNDYVSLGSGLPDLDIKLALKGELGCLYGDNEISLVSAEGVTYGYTSRFTYVHETSFSSSNRDRFLLDNSYIYWWYQEPANSFNGGESYKIENNSLRVVGVFLADGTEKESRHYYIQPGEYVIITPSVSCDRIYYRDKKGSTSYPIIINAYSRPNGSTSNIIVENTQDNFSKILGLANKFISEAEADGKFVTPFYARVGLRLYDQSISSLTVPILLTPNRGNFPWIITTSTPAVSGTPATGHCGISAMGFKTTIQYKIESGLLRRLNDWQDIILGITISITPPIYTYNQGFEFDETKETFLLSGFTTDADSVPYSSFGSMYGKFWYYSDGNETYFANYKPTTSEEALTYDKRLPASTTLGRIYLPTFSDEEIKEHYTKFAQFNVLKDIETSDLTADTWTDVDTEDINVSLSENWELTPDDNLSNDTIAATTAYTYNSRLHLAGVSRYFWSGRWPNYMIGYDDFAYLSNSNYRVRVVVQITEDGQTYYTDTGWSANQPNMNWYWFFYPNINATSAIIYVEIEGSPNTYLKTTLKLEKHKTLNGVYWFKDYEAMFLFPYTRYNTNETEANKEYDTSPYIRPNLLYVSEVNNPFVFPTTSRLSIGDEEIIGLSTTAKALSEGQYGQFPLYVFCTDGVWTISVGDTGAYSYIHPLSRDVCTNPDSITQLDGAVAFVTKQGLKMVSGSDIVLLSEAINGHNVGEDFFTGAVESFMEQVRTTYSLFSVDNVLLSDTDQFVEQVQTAKIAYDYPHNLLHVFTGLVSEDGDTERHFVYSFDEKEWSTQTTHNGQCYAVVPGYPLTTIQCGLHLMVYDNVVRDDKQIGYALTRVNTLGNPLSRKALYDLRTIGQFYSDGMRRVAVYVSEDKQTWYRLTSLKKFSAKYYRFLVMTYQSDLDALNGITTQYVERFTNKMR